MITLDFFFYYGCPWTYLAFSRVRETAMRTGANIAWKPILVDRVQARLGLRPEAGHAPTGLLPAKARYQVKDLADWNRFCGLDIRHPGPFPVPAAWAVRGAIVAEQAGRLPAFSQAIFAACFRDREDIDSLDNVARIAAGVGLDAEAFARAAQEPATLDAVEANCAELVARGGFGSPTMFVGDDMYFGNDRMPLVEFALSRAGERPFVAPGAHGQT